MLHWPTQDGFIAVQQKLERQKARQKKKKKKDKKLFLILVLNFCLESRERTA